MAQQDDPHSAVNQTTQLAQLKMLRDGKPPQRKAAGFEMDKLVPDATEPNLVEQLAQVVYDGGPMVCARAAGRLNILTARLQQIVEAIETNRPTQFDVYSPKLRQALTDARRCLEDDE